MNMIEAETKPSGGSIARQTPATNPKPFSLETHIACKGLILGLMVGGFGSKPVCLQDAIGGDVFETSPFFDVAS